MPIIQHGRVTPGTGKITFTRDGGTAGAAVTETPTSQQVTFSVTKPAGGTPLYDSMTETGSDIVLALRNLVAGANVELTYNDGLIMISATGSHTSPSLYDIIGYWRGQLPSDTDPIHYLEIVRAISLPSGLTGSVAKCLVAPTGAVSLALKKNGSGIGTMNFAMNATTGTFTFASPVSFSAGDIWQVDPPDPQDASFAGLSWTIMATVQ